MSYIDIGILGIFVVCVLIGFNQGFLKAGLNCVNFFLSLLLALMFRGSLAGIITADPQIIPTIIHFSESSEMLGSVENVRLSIYNLTPEVLESILSNVQLPHPLEALLLSNIQTQAFAAQGLSTLGEYLSMTIAHMSINIVSMLTAFVISFVSIALLIHMVDSTVKFPVLRYMDGSAGAILGFLQGMLLLFVVFLCVPLILAFLPFDELTALIDASSFATFYYRSNFVIDMIKGII